MLIENQKDEKPTAVLSRNCIVALCQHAKWSTDKSQWRSIQPGGDRTVSRLKNKSKRNLDNLKKYRQKNFLCLGDHRLAKLFRTPPPTEEALCLHYSNLKIYAHIFPPALGWRPENFRAGSSEVVMGQLKKRGLFVLASIEEVWKPASMPRKWEVCHKETFRRLK